MAVLYVARSKGLSEWTDDVGLTKHVFKVGVGPASGEGAVKALNDRRAAGRDDWTLLQEKDAGDMTEEQALARLAVREKAVDPKHYPPLKDEPGMFKIKPSSVENHIIVKRALANEESLTVKVTNAEIAAYLIDSALR
ncbi:MAG: hypothetical protein EXR02_07690 [Rhodospirillales bacterium]|nr:hypothetical protein [Rhodospirillales bacterium]